jgi:poly(hydroxyalkanoate) depolymerase family esterase
MNDPMSDGMADATRLTNAGRLLEATAAIQRALGGAPAAAPPASETGAAEPAPAVLRLVRGALAPGAPPPTGGSRPKGEQGESAPPAPKWRDRLRAAVRSPRRGRHGPAPLSEEARAEVLAGGQFIEGSYANGAGTRAYKVYIPSSYQKGQALPLVVMLHGCTQDPDDFAAGTRMNLLAERDGFLVVYPSQAAPANHSRCWNWFNEADQQRDRGEPSIIAGITRHVVDTYGLDARRVYVAGLSAGGAMAVIMGVTYPDLYAAVGVHSGLPYGAAHDLPSAFAAMKQGGGGRASTPEARGRGVPMILFQGDRDQTVHPRNGEEVLAQWSAIHGAGEPASPAGSALRVTSEQGQAPGGQAYTRSVYLDAGGSAVIERWVVHGGGHGWSGGSPNGSFTEPQGPDASREMVRFFSRYPRPEPLDP